MQKNTLLALRLRSYYVLLPPQENQLESKMNQSNKDMIFPLFYNLLIKLKFNEER